MKLTTVEKKLSAREQREQEIAFNKDDDLITRIMKVLEYRGYVDTDWRSENTFEEDVRPLFEKMLKPQISPEKVEKLKMKREKEARHRWCSPNVAEIFVSDIDKILYQNKKNNEKEKYKEK